MKIHAITIALAIAFSSTSCDKDKKGEEVGNQTSVTAAPSISKHEELANKVMDSMKEFATTISSVSDLESANKAATKISEIGDRFSSIANELESLDPPTQDLKEAINAKMEARDAEMQKIMGPELQTTMQSLGPEAQQVLQEAFGDFFAKADSAGKELERHFNIQNNTNN